MNEVSLVSFIKLNKYISPFIFIVVAFLFIGISINFHFFSHFINGGDTFQWINFGKFIKSNLYIWNSSSSGLVLPMMTWDALNSILLYIINIFVNNKIFAINIYWVISLFIVEYSYYIFYRLFLSKGESIVATMLSIFNIYFLINFHTPEMLNLLGYIAFPVMYYLVHNFFAKNQIIYIFFYVLFQVVLFRIINIEILLNILVPILFFLMYRRYVSIYKYIVFFLVVGFGILIMSCALFIDFGTYYFASNTNTILTKYNQNALSINDVYNLDNIFKLTPNYGFLKNNGKEYPGLQGKDFSILYLHNPYFIVVSYTFIFIFILSLFLSAKDRRVIRQKKLILSSIILILFFLAKGLNEPLHFINAWLYSNNIYLTFFRSGAKYFLFILTPLVILHVFLTNKYKKIIYVLSIIYILSHMYLIFVFSKPVHHSWNTILPYSYIDITKKLSELKDNNKILIIPITQHFVGYTDYKDGYSGPDRLYTLSEKTFLLKIHSTIISEKYTNMINNIENEPSKINEYANKLAYKYILVEKDTVYSKYHKIKNYKEYVDYINEKQWVKMYENQDFILFKLDDAFFSGRIYADNSNIIFNQINPTTYNVHINNLHHKTTLSFLETYNDGWNIYIRKYSYSNNKCVNRRVYTNNNIECFYKNKISLNNVIRSLKYAKLTSRTHLHKYEYANAWIINPQYIKQHFSKEYYKENPDGSIDIQLTIYFKPQSYYVIGLLISGLSFLGMSSFLIFDFIKRRNNKLN